MEFFSGPYSLAGQIDFPDNLASKHAGFLLVPGPSQHTRTGDARGFPGFNNYYTKFIRVLNESNYAVLSYDKGGTGRSSSGLSSRADIVSAYRCLVGNEKIDQSKIGIIAFGGGAAHIYRKWDELNNITTFERLILISTGLNDLKMEQMNLSVLSVVGEELSLRTQNAMERYTIKTGQNATSVEIKNANENLCLDPDDKVTMIKENSCHIPDSVFEAISNWLNSLD